MKYLHRDRINTVGREDANKFDYEYFLHHAKDKVSKAYCDRNKNALLKLIKLVMENELTDKQRQVVILVKLNGLSSKEAARELNLSESTVSRHLSAAKRKFDNAYKYFDCVKYVGVYDE